MEQSAPLGLKILELRKKNKMTQGDLADKIGISRAAISQFEKGDSKPSYETLTKLSTVLGLDLTALVNQAPARPTPTPIADDINLVNPGNKTIMVLDHNSLGDYTRRIQEREDNPDFNPEEWQPQHRMSIMTIPPSLLGRGVHIVFPIIGKTMEPNFIEEDSILCSFVPPNQWDDIERNSVCALVSLVYGLIIARIILSPDKEKVTCVFDNTRYRAIDLERSRIKQIFRLKWHLPIELEPTNGNYLIRYVNNLQKEIDDLKNWSDRKKYEDEEGEPLLGTGSPQIEEPAESPQPAPKPDVISNQQANN
jgi:transcriptional regulator with XRE-family HTH domain